ncbi:MAG: RNA polymerase sigma factor SigZ [Bacteroidota bacterium]|jgi:RNA polymerase sigma-70 factor (ECF subfamily)|nr:RNA polymerase sigma factor SigZ [Bacteroidota bacterium]
MSTPNHTQPNCDVPALWQEHKNALYHFILKRVKDSYIAEDILQEVLLKIYQFCLTKSGVNNLKSWLFQIAQNTITDYYRKQKNTTDTNIPEIWEEETENTAFEEAQQYILPMLNFLPEAYATPLRMYDIEQKKQADIAQELNLSLSATKSRIQRARQLLKAEFITCCRFETDKQGNIIAFQIKASCAPLQAIKKEIEK